jgi:hypothetical protein
MKIDENDSWDTNQGGVDMHQGEKLMSMPNTHKKPYD